MAGGDGSVPREALIIQKGSEYERRKSVKAEERLKAEAV